MHVYTNSIAYYLMITNLIILFLICITYIYYYSIVSHISYMLCKFIRLTLKKDHKRKIQERSTYTSRLIKIIINYKIINQSN